MSLQSKTDEAIQYLRENEPEQGYDCKFSGGKDSIVVYDLVKRAGVKHTVHYHCTTIDPPEVTRFIRKHYPEVKWVMPKKTFFKYVETAGAPTRLRRWCCSKLKHRSQPKGASRHVVMGLRAEESKKRAERGRTNRNEENRLWQYAPIYNFNEGEIWDYIEESNLPYPALYDEGFHRLGCVVCPFICRTGSIERHRDRWPMAYKSFERAMGIHYESRKEWYNEQAVMNLEQLLDLWYYSKPFPLSDRAKMLQEREAKKQKRQVALSSASSEERQ